MYDQCCVTIGKVSGGNYIFHVYLDCVMMTSSTIYVYNYDYHFLPGIENSDKTSFSTRKCVVCVVEFPFIPPSLYHPSLTDTAHSVVCRVQSYTYVLYIVFELAFILLGRYVTGEFLLIRG